MVGTEAVPFPGNRRFEVLRRIGAGGMGIVYAVRDRDQNTTVALKYLKDVDPKNIARFKREFRTLADLQHRNLVRLGELFCEDGQWFFTMELLAGVDFLSWVRHQDGKPLAVETVDPAKPLPAMQCDEARLRAALKQLALGLYRLHDAGKVHRDIKPSNVLVTADGRVVLLDFGLVTDSHRKEVSETDVFGTARYMAPEQASGKPVGPEADWYAVGTVLYEALTGRPPFSGPQMELLLNKLRKEALPPRALVDELPEDLHQLCVDLLRAKPQARPGGRQILDRLRVVDGEVVEMVPPAGSGPALAAEGRFVGRERELERLRQAFDDSQRGASVTMFVEGESGMGKSSLIRRFADRLREENPEVMVLAGRCFERESVPYKAFDGLMDAFGDVLQRMNPIDAALLLSGDAGALARLFPGLRRVPVVAALPEVQLPEPQELRRAAFLALRTTLRRVAERWPLVLCIDDFQWTDADSVALLADLLRPPDAPPFLLLCTVQTGVAEDPIAEVRGQLGDERRLELEALPREEAERLARAVMGEGSDKAALVAHEAGGHPLFIQVLCSHLAETGERVQLDDVLWSRVAKLDPASRRLLELLAVAGQPLTYRAAALAAELDGDALFAKVNQLRAAQLVRRTGSHFEDSLETYHYQVRQAVLLNLTPSELRARHIQIAEVLERTTMGERDPVSLVWHLEAAGELERAAVHARRAARLAADSLAFARAAQLYGTALRLGRCESEETRKLHIALGEALAHAGRARHAAQSFQAGAEGAPPAEALDLNRRAAEQLLICGHVADGMKLIDKVLEQVGIKRSRTAAGALASIAWRRAHIRLRGLGYRRREESEIPADELTRMDTCWSLAIGMAFVDFFHSAEFQMRHSQLALRAGEPYRVARALSAETIIAALGGARTQARTARLLTALKALAEETGHPHALGLAAYMAQNVAVMQGRWREAAVLTREVERHIRERAPGMLFENDAVKHNSVMVSWYLGDLKEMCARVPLFLRIAEERGAVILAAMSRTGMASLYWLVRDDPQGARRQALTAIAKWPADWPHPNTYNDFVAEVQIDLYSSPDSPLAWERVRKSWPALKRTPYMRMQVVRIKLIALRAQAALAAAASAAGRDREALCRHAEAAARRIEREGAAWGLPVAQLLWAGAAHLRGQSERAQSLLERAAQAFTEADMALYAAVAQRRRGLLVGGPMGHALVAAADEWMHAQTVKAPARLADMLAPGFQR
jgi:tRNA A-37 threonylcarbamoyl transferase component Bud32